MRFVTRLLLAAYLIEAGVLLIITPWTTFWERNRFAELAPLIGHWMTNPFVRGAVSGVGVITAAAGIRDLIVLLFFRRTRVVPTPSEPPA